MTGTANDRLDGMAKSVAGPTIANHPESYRYLLQHSLRWSPPQERLMRQIEECEKPEMAGSPEEAQFLGWLCELTAAEKVLEVGVFRGSTTLAIALALPTTGKVYGLDISEAYCESGRKHWRESGVENKIELMIGSAVESMDELLQSGHQETFDLVFVDADKGNYDNYYEKGLQLLKKNGVVAVDNTLWHGRLTDDENLANDPTSQAIHALNKKIHEDARVSISMLGIADGLTLCRKR